MELTAGAFKPVFCKLTEDDLDALWMMRLQALRDNPEAFGSTYEETVARGKEVFCQRLGQGDDVFYLGAFDDTLIGISEVLQKSLPAYLPA
jgi:hypothetical protein